MEVESEWKARLFNSRFNDHTTGLTLAYSALAISTSFRAARSSNNGIGWRGG